LLPGGDGVLFSVVMPGTGAVNDGGRRRAVAVFRGTVIVRSGGDAQYVSDELHVIYGVRKDLMAFL
jgi:hypothetical protein